MPPAVPGLQLAQPGSRPTPQPHAPGAASSPANPWFSPAAPARHAVGDLARRFGLGAEMISSVLCQRLASGLVRGKMEAGVIYTAAYLARIKAQLR